MADEARAVDATGRALSGGDGVSGSPSGGVSLLGVPVRLVETLPNAAAPKDAA